MNPTITKTFFAPVKQIAKSAVGAMNHLLWPEVCDNCRDSILETQNGLCHDCWYQLLESVGGDYCPQCGRDASKYAIIQGRCPKCQEALIHFDAIARGGVYEESLRRMILAFKFRDHTELDTQLCMLANSALRGSTFFDSIDVFVPVPLHWLRHLGRGYNQSLIICKGLEHRSAVISSDLVRSRYTARQWNLTATKRKENVSGAFAVRRGHGFSGRNVCIVDDITTSGSTLNECARTLKEAGAVKIFAVVLAVAQHGS